MLSLRHLQVSLEEQPIIHDVTLQINPGEIHAIMGPNGSGKSTLALTLAGHPTYTVGAKSKALLNKTNLLELTPDARARAGLFLAFQYPSEVSGVSVYNFLRAMWEARFGSIGPEKPESYPENIPHFTRVIDFREYAQEVAREYGIPSELLQRNLNEGFSGGERKKLELLQMALFRPLFAVLDETDSGLDIDAVQTVAKGARKVVDTHHTGMLVITHYQRILKFLQPDFVHVMVKGRIVKSGGPELAQQLEHSGYQEWIGEPTEQ